MHYRLQTQVGLIYQSVLKTQGDMGSLSNDLDKSSFFCGRVALNLTLAKRLANLFT